VDLRLTKTMRPYFIPLLIAATVACQSAPVENTAASSQVPEVGPVSRYEVSDPVGAPEPASAPVKTATVDPDPSAPPPQDELQDGVDTVKRQREQGKMLAEQYVERGDYELSRADLREALDNYARALDIDPSNERARAGVRKVQGLLGDEYSSIGLAFEDQLARERVKRAQALLEALDHAKRGDAAVHAGEFEEALQAYRQAQTVLRYHPLIATESLDERIVNGKIEETTGLRDDAVIQAAEDARREAEEARLRAEQSERQRRETKLQEFFENANKAFVADRFEQAERWCDMILLEDPGNSHAQSLRRVARESRHHRADENNRKHYRQAWIRTFEELETMDVPQTDALQFQIERWREVHTRKPLTHRQLDPTVNLEREEILRRLEAVRIESRFGDEEGGTPLEVVASYLQQLTGINFLISNAVWEDLDEEETSIMLRLPERSVRKVLDIIAETRESLRWKVSDGVVTFVTVDELTGGQQLVTYGVQDLIHPIPDYPGRDINVQPSGLLVPPDEDYEEREANVINTTLLEDLIRNNIAPESWDADEANSIRITENGIMTVNQTPEVQEQIEKLLDDLREATGIMVDIQARFMKVEDSFLEDIGIDLRGLGAPGLGDGSHSFNDFGDTSASDDLADGPGRDNTLGAFYDEGEDGDIRARVEALYDSQLGTDEFQRSGGLSFQWTYLSDLQLQMVLRAVSKSERLELVTAPKILVHNTARANLSILNQVAYLQDFNVEIAQAASIADPIVAVIQDGVILDVKPVVSADRRFITLELRPTIAVLKRPIEERITTLGSQNSVTIMLPELEIQRVRTSIPIPDGGTVMLGGMKESTKRDLRSGVPILNKIPILSAFFERKGNFIQSRKLLILLKADIVIPEELEPTRPEMGLTE